MVIISSCSPHMARFCWLPAAALAGNNLRQVVFIPSKQYKAPSTPVTLSNATSQFFSTKSNVASTMLPVSATMSNEISFFRQSRNKLNLFWRFNLDDSSIKSCLILFESLLLCTAVSLMNPLHCLHWWIVVDDVVISSQSECVEFLIWLFT